MIMNEPIARYTRRWRQPLALLATLLFVYIVLSVDHEPWRSARDDGWLKPAEWLKHPSRQFTNSLNLTVAQCSAAFPNLTADIDRTVGLGPFTLTQATGNMGPLQARIKDGQVSRLACYA